LYLLYILVFPAYIRDTIRAKLSLFKPNDRIAQNVNDAVFADDIEWGIIQDADRPDIIKIFNLTIDSIAILASPQVDSTKSIKAILDIIILKEKLYGIGHASGKVNRFYFANLLGLFCRGESNQVRQSCPGRGYPGVKTLRMIQSGK